MERRAKSCEPEPYRVDIPITPLQRELFGDNAHEIIFEWHKPRILEQKIAREQEIYKRRNGNQ